MRFKLFSIFIILICIFISSLNEVKAIQPCGTNKLVTKMHIYFTEVLSMNYEGESSKELYTKFLTDYIESWINNSSLTLDIDKEKLTKINSELFKRDLSHYYYFYPEVIINELNGNISSLQRKMIQDTDIPTVVVHIDKEISEKSYYKINSVHLVVKNGFIADIQKNNDLRTISFINNTIKLIGEVPFFNMAAFFVKSSAGMEIADEIVQQMIAVVFWKYLCIQTDIDFYAPLKKSNHN